MKNQKMTQFTQTIGQSIGSLALLLAFLPSVAWSGQGPDQISIVWNSNGIFKELKSWSISEISRLKQQSSREKEPGTGKLAQWTGVSFSSFLEKTLDELPPELRATVDLIVLKNAQGGQATIPRNLITKYPVLIAHEKNNRKLSGAEGPTTVVIPWTSKPKIQEEGFPLDGYFLSGVTRIELSNFKDRYSAMFLKRRTDPLAIRGEKIFVHNCTSCHTPAGLSAKAPSNLGPTLDELAGESRARKLASGGHPDIRAGFRMPKLADRDRRALVSYLDAYRSQTSQAAQSPQSTSEVKGIPVSQN